MKKTIKRMMALMLSLVMVLGFVPCLNNVASAATDRTLKIKNVTAGTSVNLMEVWLDDTILDVKCYHNGKQYYDVFVEGETYQIKNNGKPIGASGDIVTIEEDPSSLITLPASFDPAASSSPSDNQYYFAPTGFKYCINFTVKETYHLEIENAKVGANISDLKLMIGDDEVQVNSVCDDESHELTDGNFELNKEYIAYYSLFEETYKPLSLKTGENSSISFMSTYNGYESSGSPEHEYYYMYDDYQCAPGYYYEGSVKFTIVDTDDVVITCDGTCLSDGVQYQNLLFKFNIAVSGQDHQININYDTIKKNNTKVLAKGKWNSETITSPSATFSTSKEYYISMNCYAQKLSNGGIDAGVYPHLEGKIFYVPVTLPGSGTTWNNAVCKIRFNENWNISASIGLFDEMYASIYYDKTFYADATYEDQETNNMGELCTIESNGEITKENIESIIRSNDIIFPLNNEKINGIVKGLIITNIFDDGYYINNEGLYKYFEHTVHEKVENGRMYIPYRIYPDLDQTIGVTYDSNTKTMKTNLYDEWYIAEGVKAKSVLQYSWFNTRENTTGENILDGTDSMYYMFPDVEKNVFGNDIIFMCFNGTLDTTTRIITSDPDTTIYGANIQVASLNASTLWDVEIEFGENVPDEILVEPEGEAILNGNKALVKNNEMMVGFNISDDEEFEIKAVNFIPQKVVTLIPELTTNYFSKTEPGTYLGRVDLEFFGDNPLFIAPTGSTEVFTVEEPAPTSGSSKTYKATDKEDSVAKIAGSGKKGSTRTITPIEGKKVGRVVVTDKDGNKIDVTKNADGTYSFIQPASNVNVEVSYVNREITLNIGSTLASVDDETTNLDVCPVIRNDRTMLPIRFVAENLGAKVEWDEKNPNYVVITRGDTKIEITLGSDKMLVNGKEVKLDSVAFAENDRTYLPVRAVSENLNAIVEWNEVKPMEVKIYER